MAKKTRSKAVVKATRKKSRNAATRRTKSRSAATKQTRAYASVVSLSTGKLPAVKALETTVRYHKRASKFSAARNKDTIHPRKMIPKAPVGKKVGDARPTMALAFEEAVPAAALRRMRTAPMTPSDTVTLKKNVQLNDVATADTASHVCEPSAALNGDVIFYTGNWFAALSIDGGDTFRFVDPFSTFPNPVGMSFCCDQVVQYIKSIDTFIWLLQYTKDSSGKNVQRIAYATTARVKTGQWRFFDIKPAGLGLAPAIWLDFPDLATGTNMLYMTTNCFNSANAWQASAVVRIALSSFTSNTLSASRSVSTTHPSLRVAQNCGTTAYFAAHQSTSSLRVFSWNESSAAPTTNDITVASWARAACISTTPDGRKWLARADGRHTGAALAANELWFAWGSAQGGTNARPHPFVQIARINRTTMTLIENINLWDPNSAIFYAALSTNSNDEIGVAYTIGGGTRFPTHVVGILTGTRRQVTTFASTRGPSDNKWGDYLTVRRHYPSQKLFCATGYSLQSGAGSSDATPHFTVFGRSSDV